MWGLVCPRALVCVKCRRLGLQLSALSCACSTAALAAFATLAALASLAALAPPPPSAARLLKLAQRLQQLVAAEAAGMRRAAPLDRRVVAVELDVQKPAADHAVAAARSIAAARSADAQRVDEGRQAVGDGGAGRDEAPVGPSSRVEQERASLLAGHGARASDERRHRRVAFAVRRAADVGAGGCNPRPPVVEAVVEAGRAEGVGAAGRCARREKAELETASRASAAGEGLDAASRWQAPEAAGRRVEELRGRAREQEERAAARVSGEWAERLGGGIPALAPCSCERRPEGGLEGFVEKTIG
mmetsp:Transcript_42367/g.137466  ORF Transcript_42367/g.137466 Transcript_42367/m.137466 type:complete len:302 (-) Transcript_42367:13-918(-)